MTGYPPKISVLVVDQIVSAARACPQMKASPFRTGRSQHNRTSLAYHLTYLVVDRPEGIDGLHQISVFGICIEDADIGRRRKWRGVDSPSKLGSSSMSLYHVPSENTCQLSS